MKQTFTLSANHYLHQFQNIPMKSKYSDEKHKFTVFSGHRIIASAWQAPRGAIPAKSLFCFYDALVNHY